MVHLLHRLYGVDAPGWTAIAGDLVDDDRARQRWPRNTVGPVRYKKGEATVTVTMTMNHFVSVGRQTVTKMHSDTTEMAMKASVVAYFAAWWTATPDDLVDDDPARLVLASTDGEPAPVEDEWSDGGLFSILSSQSHCYQIFCMHEYR